MGGGIIAGSLHTTTDQVIVLGGVAIVLAVLLLWSRYRNNGE